MSVLNKFEAVKKNLFVKEHPLVDADLSFRIMYISGLSILVYGVEEKEDNVREELMKTISEELHIPTEQLVNVKKVGQDPSTALIEEIVANLQEDRMKYAFLLDCHRIVMGMEDREGTEKEEMKKIVAYFKQFLRFTPTEQHFLQLLLNGLEENGTEALNKAFTYAYEQAIYVERRDFYYFFHDENWDNGDEKRYEGASRKIEGTEQWIYFIDYENNCFLCRMTHDKTKREVLVESKVRTFKLYKDNIFYTTYFSNSKSESLWKTTMDGLDRRVICEDFGTEHFSLYLDRIFYPKGNRLFTMDRNGANTKEVNRKIALYNKGEFFSIHDDLVYFISNYGSLCSCDISKKESDITKHVEKLINNYAVNYGAVNVVSLQTNRNGVFYCEKHSIHKLNRSTGELKEIINRDDKIVSFTLDEESLYFTAVDQTKGTYEIYRGKTNGKDVKIMGHEGGVDLQPHEPFLYFFDEKQSKPKLARIFSGGLYMNDTAMIGKGDLDRAISKAVHSISGIVSALSKNGGI
ncbi:DUF5050 domain-containing protein [Evansella sp. AB-P1]|uniref:DUF5050 domain-containing protein n=1 Tax=Evansella sp. AB-P1 TaxID=3037653 RepID=UPI00241E30BC|nr:DUF5050 domain-containing protein [Evansella sp. AB-P1]MDG5789327.1 DUF5050 domain-containing protein [Evansella sp. AB-P1]